MSIGNDNFTASETVQRPAATVTQVPLGTAATEAARQSDATRQRITREFAAVLAGIVYRLRKPLLTVALLPVPTAIVVFAFAIDLGGSAGFVLGALSVLPALLGGWLIWQRQQLLRATNPMEKLAEDVGRVFDLTDAWSHAGESVEMLRALSRNGWGPLRVLRGVWATVQFGPGLLEGMPGLPRRILPFAPRRLQTTATVAGLCLLWFALTAMVALILGIGRASGLL